MCDAVANQPPLVSVAITSYNSAPYIARAVGSALRQNTPFLLEIVIGDDCSRDGTQGIVRELQQQHPAVRMVERPVNVGMQRNYYDLFEHCRGKYIAWLDADDYWTDKDKLQIQVALLESDASVSACGHFVRQVDSVGNVAHGRCPAMLPGRYGLQDIIRTNFVPSPSIMFRNGTHRTLPQAFFHLTGVVDWPILIRSALAGDVVLLDQVMADYTLHLGSAYQGKGPLYQDAIDLECYDMMWSMLPQMWQRSIRAAKGKRYEAFAYHLAKKGDLPGARRAACKAIRTPHVLDNAFSKVQAFLYAEVLGRIARHRQNSLS